MNIKYFIFSLIILADTSCYGAACLGSLACANNRKKIKNRAQQTQIDLEQAKLFKAAISNHLIDELEEAIQNGANVNARDEDGNTPLMQAATKNKARAVQTLLYNGADISLINNNGETALRIAFQKNAKATKQILSNAKLRQEELCWAAVTNNMDLLNRAIQNGANVNTSDDGYTALNSAICWGNIAIVIELLKNKADVNMIKNKNDRTPLMEAAAKNNIEAVQALLDHGANINLTNNKGKTALDIAKQKNAYAVIPILEQGDVSSISNSNTYSVVPIMEHGEVSSISKNVDDTTSGYEFSSE